MSSDWKTNEYSAKYLLQKSVDGSDWETLKEYDNDSACTKAMRSAKEKLKEKGNHKVRIRSVIHATLLRAVSYYSLQDEIEAQEQHEATKERLAEESREKQRERALRMQQVTDDRNDRVKARHAKAAKRVAKKGAKKASKRTVKKSETVES